MADIIEHFKKGTFEVEYWLPAHNDRRESTLFKRNKKFIRDECGAPCWVCGSKDNREVHHIFEWAFWNALDPRKVTNVLNAIEFYDEDYTSKADKVNKLRARIRRLEQSKPIIDTEEGRIRGKKLGRDWVVISLDYKRKRRPKGGQGNEKVK